MPPDPPRLAPPRKPTAPHSPAPPREGSAPMPEFGPAVAPGAPNGPKLAPAPVPAAQEPPDLGCTHPPAGWYCSREPKHTGPCAARPVVGSTLSGLGRLPPPLPRVDEPKSDPFPSDEAPTPIKRLGPFTKVEFRGPGASQTARTFRNYEALSEENKRLVDALVLALRGTVDGGR